MRSNSFNPLNVRMFKRPAIRNIGCGNWLVKENAGRLERMAAIAKAGKGRGDEERGRAASLGGSPLQRVSADSGKPPDERAGLGGLKNPPQNELRISVGEMQVDLGSNAAMRPKATCSALALIRNSF
jgi:hypothetical protein